jgi:hypothetical protein
MILEMKRLINTGTKLRVIAEVEIHKIASCPKLMPYNDMIN